MRITNSMKLNISINSVTSQDEKLMNLQEQVSAGKKILKPSDDPIGMGNSIKFSAQKNDIEIYKSNMVYAKNFVSSSDTMMEDVSTMLTRYKELAVRGCNGTLTASDRDEIANEMDSLLNHIISDANYTGDEGYIFAGTEKDTQPFAIGTETGRRLSETNRLLVKTNVTSVKYNGDRSDILRNETEGARMKVNLTGEEAFMNVNSQIVYSTKTFDDPNKGPFDDSLKEGYFTIKGRDFDEVIKVEKGDSMQNIVDRINKNSKVASARIVTETKGSRIAVEAREKGTMNQFALIEGAKNFPGKVTNMLELFGLNSKVESTKKIQSIKEPIATQVQGLISGTFFINGVSIYFDSKKDSLNDIADKINDNVKNVDSKVVDGKLVIEATGSLNIKDDSSNLIKNLGFPSSRASSSAAISDSMIEPQTLSKNEWVKSGYFKINGVQIGISDSTKETLYELRDRVNGLAINATASIAGDQFIIDSGMPPNATTALTNISDGTSEFLKSFEFSYQSSDLKALNPALTADTKLVTAGLGITAGSEFTIKGKVFKVTTEDTLRSMVEKINFENYGAQASLVETGGQLRLALSPAGVRDSLSLSDMADLTVNNPGSNFLSSIVMGNRIASKAELTSPLIQGTIKDIGVTGATSDLKGSISVNGVVVEYDQNADSVTDIVNRINSKVPGIDVYVNSNNQIVFNSSENLSIFDNTVIAGKTIAGPPVNTATATLASAGVTTAGTFFMNGEAVNVDPADTLDAFMSKFNTQFTGRAKVYFDSSVNSVKFINMKADQPITITAGTSDITSSTALDLVIPNATSTNIARRSSSNFVEKMSIKNENITDSKNNSVINIARSSQQAYSLFDILIEIRDNFYDGNTEAVSNNIKDANSQELTFMGGLAKLDAGISHIVENRAFLGSNLSQIQKSATRNNEVQTYLETLIADTENIDVEKAIIELNTADLIYNASLQLFAKANQNSLLNFLQ